MKIIVYITKLKDLFRYLFWKLPEQIDLLNKKNDRLMDSVESLNEQADFLNHKNSILINSIESLNEQVSFLKCELNNSLDYIKILEKRINEVSDYLYIMDFYNPELSLINKENNATHILIVGFYGGYNLGDELMLQTLLSCLQNNNGIHITLMLSENAEYNISQRGKVDVIHYCRTTSDFSHISSAFDILIVGGGALLDDAAYHRSWHHFISLATIVAELPNYFSAKNKPVICLGLSTNRVLRNREYIKTLKSTIEGSHYFSVRDPLSKKTLSDANIPTEKVEIIDDLILADPQWLNIPKRQHSDKKTITITWVNYSELQPLLVETIESIIINDPTIKIALVPMYEYNSADTNYFSEIKNMLPPTSAEHVFLFEYPNSLDKAVELFSQADAAINIRYHAGLICGALGIPQVIVLLKDHPHYPNKMSWIAENFQESIEMTDTDANGEEISAKAVASLVKPYGETIDPVRVRNNIKQLNTILTI